jgi:hypothetical protein
MEDLEIKNGEFENVIVGESVRGIEVDYNEMDLVTWKSELENKIDELELDLRKDIDVNERYTDETIWELKCEIAQLKKDMFTAIAIVTLIFIVITLVCIIL